MVFVLLFFFRLPAALKLFFNYFISRARYTKPNQTKSEKKNKKVEECKEKSASDMLT